MNRHAYLIIAHNEFPVLELLVRALDDPRNDIYIHLDSKVATPPQLSTKQAGLYLLKQRRDVRWGDVSIVRTEYDLFAEAYHSGRGYSYYHLLSGVDLPLKNQDYIHSFFEQYRGQEFVGYYWGEDLEVSIDRKVRRRHIFAADFKGSGLGFLVKKTLRFLWLRTQFALGIRRYQSIEFKKGTQWVSLTNEFVGYILERRTETERLYRQSFCSDEIFVQTLLWHSPYKNRIFDLKNEDRGCMREIGWSDNALYDYSRKDKEHLLRSKALWARKFNSRDMDFLRELLEEAGVLKA